MYEREFIMQSRDWKRLANNKWGLDDFSPVSQQMQDETVVCLRLCMKTTL